MMRHVDSFGGGFVEILPELAPEALEHAFDSGIPSWVLGDKVGIEADSFSLLALMDILTFIFWSDGPGGVSGGLLLDLETGVDVLCKESYFAPFRSGPRGS